MIQIKGIDHVAVNVRDIDKSVEFYTKIIGLNITQREPSKPGVEYFLDCGPSLIGIIQAKDLTRNHAFENEGLGANHFSFRVHSKDFEPMIKRLAAIVFIFFCTSVAWMILGGTIWNRTNDAGEQVRLCSQFVVAHVECGRRLCVQAGDRD